MSSIQPKIIFKSLEYLAPFIDLVNTLRHLFTLDSSHISQKFSSA